MIPLAKPIFSDDETRAVQRVIESGWVTQGPVVGEFERAFSSATGAEHSVAVSNCTAAMQLTLFALGVRPGDAVITVSHSFIATANCVRACGAEPLFVDIDESSFNMDPSDLKRFLHERCDLEQGELILKDPGALYRDQSPLRYVAPERLRIKAVLVPHQAGMPADLRQILPLCASVNVPVVEDAACALGSRACFDPGNSELAPIGRPYGYAACFSFHPRKVITTGDGGMITVKDGDVAERLRRLRHHGMSVSDLTRHSEKTVVMESFPETGFNYRLTDIQAAVGVAQMSKLEAIIRKRRALGEEDLSLLHGHPDIQLPSEPPWAEVNWQSFIITLSERAAGHRQRIMDQLLALGVSTRRGILNAHTEPAYLAQDWSLPKSESVAERTITLPLYPELESCATVCSALEDALPRTGCPSGAEI